MYIDLKDWQVKQRKDKKSLYARKQKALKQQQAREKAAKDAERQRKAAIRKARLESQEKAKKLYGGKATIDTIQDRGMEEARIRRALGRSFSSTKEGYKFPGGLTSMQRSALKKLGYYFKGGIWRKVA